MIKGYARKYFEGKTCIFCGKYGLYKLKDKRVKCKHCKKYYSLNKLRRDLQLLYYFYLEISARRAVNELEINYNAVQSGFMHFRKCISYYCSEEARKLNGELELDESYFGGKRKGQRGRGARNKTIVLGFSREKARFTL